MFWPFLWRSSEWCGVARRGWGSIPAPSLNAFIQIWGHRCDSSQVEHFFRRTFNLQVLLWPFRGIVKGWCVPVCVFAHVLQADGKALASLLRSDTSSAPAPGDSWLIRVFFWFLNEKRWFLAGPRPDPDPGSTFYQTYWSFIEQLPRSGTHLRKHLICVTSPSSAKLGVVTSPWHFYKTLQTLLL